MSLNEQKAPFANHNPKNTDTLQEKSLIMKSSF